MRLTNLRRTSQLLAWVAALLAIGGCGTYTPSHTRVGGSPSVHATGSATGASASPSPPPGSPSPLHTIPASAFVGQPPFSGPAVAKFGQHDLHAAYVELVNFAFATGWNSHLIVKDRTRLSLADLATVRANLTPACRRTFDATFAKVVLGDQVAVRKLEEAVLFGVTGPHGLRPPTTGTIVTARRFTPASVGLDRAQAGGRLTVAFAAKAKIRMVSPDGNTYSVPTSRVARYWLVRNDGPDRAQRPFLIDAWAINLTVKAPSAF